MKEKLKNLWLKIRKTVSKVFNIVYNYLLNYDKTVIALANTIILVIAFFIVLKEASLCGLILTCVYLFIICALNYHYKSRFSKILRNVFIGILAYVALISVITLFTIATLYNSFPTPVSNSDWLGYIANIIGAFLGALTSGIVLLLTIRHSDKQHKENIRVKYLPYISLISNGNNGVDFNIKIKNIGSGPAISLKILSHKNNEPILEYMNLGKDDEVEEKISINNYEEIKYKILFEDLTGNYYEQELTYNKDKSTFSKFVVKPPKLIKENTSK